MLDVSQIEPRFLLKIETISTVDLGVARDTGLDREEAPMSAFIGFDFGREMRPRANQTHSTDEDRSELWEFIQRRLAQSRSNAGDTRIIHDFGDETGTDVLGGSDKFLIFLGSGATAISVSDTSLDLHTTKLVKGERASTLPDT